MTLMAKQKLSPRDQKTIVARIAAGEKQVTLAREFGVNKSSISRLVKRSAKGTPKETPIFRDLSDTSEEQLRNRFSECGREMLEIADELRRNARECQNLQVQIENATRRLKSGEDAEYCAALRAGITANRAQLTFLQNPQQIAFSYARLLREQSEIVYELGRRGVYHTLEACIL